MVKFKKIKLKDGSKCLIVNWNQFALLNTPVWNLVGIINHIKNEIEDEMKVVLHMETETIPFVDNNIIELHEWFDKNDYNPNNIYFIQENPNLKYFYDIFCEEKQIKRKFNFVQRIIKRTSDMDFAPNLSPHPHLSRKDFYESSNLRSKKIITFNSTPREHRKDIIEFLLPYKDECYLSYNSCEIKHYKDDFVEDLELKIDDEYDKGIKYIYSNSYINVITETEFYNNAVHITEKTWRAFSQYQPFILVTGPFALDYLQDIGFKLPKGLIDYSFDKVVDSKKRMKMIQVELQKIMDTDIKTIHEWYWSNENILIHNNDTYYNNSLYEDFSYQDYQTYRDGLVDYIEYIINSKRF
tara:strand:- start:1567 stop:2628 length:1062 start_codon:yes stop_codon:yes gene_type:complete